MKVGVLLVFRLGCEAPLEMVRRKGVIQAIIDRHAFMHSSFKESVQHDQSGVSHYT